MKLEQQVVSLELAKKLKELGVKQESYFWWDIRHINLFTKHDGKPFHSADIVSAYTVAELGEMLPYEVEHNDFTFRLVTMKVGTLWLCKYERYQGSWLGNYSIKESSEADARAKMLVYLIENNLMEV